MNSFYKLATENDFFLLIRHKLTVISFPAGIKAILNVHFANLVSKEYFSIQRLIIFFAV